MPKPKKPPTPLIPKKPPMGMIADLLLDGWTVKLDFNALQLRYRHPAREGEESYRYLHDGTVVGIERALKRAYAGEPGDG